MPRSTAHTPRSILRGVDPGIDSPAYRWPRRCQPRTPRSGHRTSPTPQLDVDLHIDRARATVTRDTANCRASDCRRKTMKRMSIVAAVLCVSFVGRAAGDQWPQFRGSQASGVAADNPALLDAWSATENV